DWSSDVCSSDLGSTTYNRPLPGAASYAILPAKSFPSGVTPPSFIRTPESYQSSILLDGGWWASSARANPRSVATTYPPPARGRTNAAMGSPTAIVLTDPDSQVRSRP